MSNLTKWTFLALCAILLTSCQTGPETAAAIGAGVAGLATVFNELAGSGVITPVQHLQAQHALEGISHILAATQQAAQLAQQTAEAAKAGSLTTGETASLVTGVTAAGVTALNAYRSATRKADIAKVAPA